MRANSLEPSEIVAAAYRRMLALGEEDPNGGCLLWPGSAVTGGYGTVTVGNTRLLVHRVAFVAVRGALSAEIQVLHKCDVPACFRDAHLTSGTQLQNMQDAVRKGRHRFQRHGLPMQNGEANPVAKLTEGAVQGIRLRAAATTKAALAREYGVTRATIRAIINRKTWVHVP